MDLSQAILGFFLIGVLYTAMIYFIFWIIDLFKDDI